jgi:type IV secretory pathway TraG/TraD family ATPase VirD4
LAVEEIRAGRGVGIIDPHGDLAERVLSLIPRHRTNDVVYFNPADAEHPIGLNLLENHGVGDRALVASTVLSIFRKAFSEFWGPRMEHVFRNALLAALETRGSTLITVLRMLVEPRFRERISARLVDPLVRHFWEEEFARYPPAFAAEVVAPVQNKLGAALSSPLLRNILGQSSSGFSIRAVMGQRQILIANLSKGRIGEDASALLGAILVGKVQLAAYARARDSAPYRVPFTLYVDEFPSFATPSLGELLAEARKYRLSLVLAHQHLGQLDEELRRAVIGNAGTLIAFRLGAEDAETLSGEFAPELTAHDLTRLDRFQIALRLSVDGATTVPFTAATLPPIEISANQSAEDVIKRVSRERYSSRILCGV